MTFTNSQRILSIREVSDRLGVHVTTLHRWSAAGKFVPKVRLSRWRVGYTSDDVDSWLAKRRDRTD